MTAMRSLFALLALVVALASAQGIETNGAFEGCSAAASGPANGYNNNLASVPSNTYFTVGPVPAVFGTCVTDFLTNDAAPSYTDILQDITTGVTAGTTYTVTITVGSAQPGSNPITFELYVGETQATLGAAVDTVTVAAPAAGADPTTDTLTFDYLATAAATISIRVAATIGPTEVPIADNLSVVDPNVVGDPHFVGFQGQVFDFIGEPDTAYNLLSDYDVQFNTFLFLRRQTHHSFIPGPVMKELVCLVDGHVVFISCGGYERPEVGYVTVDGLRLVDGQKLSLGRLSVGYKSIKAWSKDYGMAGKDYLVGSVNIHIDGAYSFHVVLVENGRNINNPNIWVTALPQRYLDFSAHILDHSRQPHGVFGQTSRLEVALDQWTIEGAETDYVLKDGVFGSDFTFNKFQH